MRFNNLHFVEGLRPSCSKQIFNHADKRGSTHPSQDNLRHYKETTTDLRSIFLNKLVPNCSFISSELVFAVDRYPFPIALAGNVITHKSVFVGSTRFQFIHFVTCAPKQHRGYLSLLGYISAFDLTTWLLILVTLMVSAGAWNFIGFTTKKYLFL